MGIIVNDIQDEYAFWYALADTQWNLGRLQPEVKDRVVNMLQKEKEMCIWSETSKHFQAKRRVTLNDLYYKMLSPQPKPVVLRKRRCYCCPWKIGDVHAFRLESDLAKENGLFGRYFLIQKVDEAEWYPAHIIPVIYVKITEGDQLPRSIEEYDALPYIRTDKFNYSHRFFPIDGRNPQKDIEEKAKIPYYVDKDGFLLVYRLKLVISKKVRYLII